jgi:hypothetical protein
VLIRRPAEKIALKAIYDVSLLPDFGGKRLESFIAASMPRRLLPARFVLFVLLQK